MRLLLLLSSCLLLAGCHKAEEGPSGVRGRVVDTATQRPVPNAAVYLLRDTGGGGFTGPVPTVQATYRADSTGTFSFSFDAEKDGHYSLRGAAPGYLSGSLESQPTVGITGGRSNTVDLPLRPEGYLRIRFRNEPPGLPTDGVSVSGLDNMGAFFGANIDTAITAVYEGGKSTKLVWFLYNATHPNGEGHSAQVLCPAHDTADFTISF